MNMQPRAWKSVLAFLLVTFSLSHSQAKDLSALVKEQPPHYQPRYVPFENGEHASYQASWNGIPVATADVRTSPLFIEGKKAFKVDVQARTMRVLDLIWKMRDSIQSVFDGGTLSPKSYVFQQRENSRSTDTHALYNPAEKKWTVSRRKGKKTSRFEINSGNTFDPITATYLMRTLDFKVGDQLRFHVFGGKSRYLLTLNVAARETVTTKAGTFDAYRIIPSALNLNSDGYAEKMREAVVWISADSRRLPVKLQSRVIIGHVYLELTADQPTQTASFQDNTAVPPSSN
jgi:hypothetical protein